MFNLHFCKKNTLITHPISIVPLGYTHIHRSISPLQGPTEDYEEDQPSDDLSLNLLPPAEPEKLPFETEETMKLSLLELQRMVLLEQLSYVRLKRALVEEQRQKLGE